MGGTSTRSPVLGLRLLRGSRRRRRKLPKPRSSTFSPLCSASADVAEHGVDDDCGALLREAGDVGHLLDERRLCQAAFGHGLVYRRKHRARASPAVDNLVRSNDSSGKTMVAPATGTTAPPRPAATAVRRISRQRTARKQRGNAGRSPASRT